MINIAILLFLALVPAIGIAQSDPCVQQFETDQRRIERDMARQLPTKGDRDSEIKWAKALDAALKQAAAKAEDCQRKSRPKPTPAAVAGQEACMARVRAAGEELLKRYGGRTMTSSEQASRRAEEMRLSDDMQACQSRSRK